jgi:hypothetical protein
MFIVNFTVLMFPSVCPLWETWRNIGRKQCFRNNVSKFAKGFTTIWKPDFTESSDYFTRVGSSEVVVVRYCSANYNFQVASNFDYFFKTVAVAIANYILPKSSQVVDYFSNSKSLFATFKICY